MDLIELGYKISGIASSFDEAITLVKEHNPNLILLDISINGVLNGIDIAEELSKSSKTPVIFLTGETDSKIVSRAKSCINCKGYLSKPVNIDELNQELVDVLNCEMV